MATRSWGIEAPVPFLPAGVHGRARVAVRQDGVATLVWETANGPDSSVSAMMYGVTGLAMGSPQAVNPGNGIGVSSPAVAALAGGNTIVAWAQQDGDLMARLYDGISAGAATRLLAAPPVIQNLAAAALGSRALLAWDLGNEVTLARVTYQPGGGVEVATTLVTEGAAQGSRPALAVSPSLARVAVAWQEAGGILVKLLSAEGATLAAPVEVVDAARGYGAGNAQLAWLSNGTLAVAWDQAPPGYETVGRQVMLRLYATYAGTELFLVPLTEPITANATAAGDQSAPSLVALPGGGLVLAWQSAEPEGTVVRLQAFDSGGQRIGGEFLVSASGDAGSLPAIAAMPDGRVTVAWTSTADGEDPGGTGFTVQIIDPRQGIVTGDAGHNRLFGNDATADEIRGLDGNDTLVGLRGDDRLFGGNGDDTLEGGRGDDILSGGAGNDLLDGGSGDDDLYGGAGDDTYVLDSEGDQVFETGGGTDTIRTAAFSVALAGHPGVENVTLLGVASLSATGTSGANVLDGGSNGGTNTLTGLGGNDTYIIGVNDFIVEADTGGIDTAQGSFSINLFLFPNVENVRLTGNLAHTATGNGGANVLDGSQNSAGNPLIGQLGNDTFILGPGDTIVEEFGGGTDTASSALVGIDLAAFAHVENLALTGALPLAGKGDGNANVLDGQGNSAANVLTGLGGNDTYVLGVGDTIVEAAGGGTDTATSATIGIDLGAFANVENVTLFGALPINAVGNAGANVMDGASNAGKNILTGLGGNDTYIIGSGDTVVEAVGGGTDTVQSASVAIDLALFPNVENATLLGLSSLGLKGSNGDNVLNGAANSGANVLIGLGGNDTYGIGLGDTVVEAENGGIDTVSSSSINLALLSIPNVENVTLTGSAPLTGGGNAFDNVLNGSTNTGANVLTGFGGNDTYIVGAGDTVVEAAISDIDTVQSATISLALASFPNVENIVLTGGLALSATGNLGANRIDGAQNSAANILIGAGGDDTYVVGAGDTVVEVTGEGNDRVLARASFTLGGGQSVEAIQADAGSSGLTLKGNLLPQTIFGGAGPDSLTGGGGGDILIGNGGFDLLNGTAGSADRFAFILPGDSAVGANRDAILGFKAAEGDRIDLQSIDANALLAGNQAFSFIGTNAITAAGQVRFFVSGGDSFIQGSVSGATTAFEIRVQGITTLAAGDFLL